MWKYCIVNKGHNEVLIVLHSIVLSLSDFVEIGNKNHKYYKYNCKLHCAALSTFNEGLPPQEG